MPPTTTTVILNLRIPLVGGVGLGIAFNVPRGEFGIAGKIYLRYHVYGSVGPAAYKGSLEWPTVDDYGQLEQNN